MAAGYLFGRATAIRQWTTSHSYDHLSELVGTSGAAQQTASYAYDPAGNRTNYAAGTSATAYAYDTAGRLTVVGPYTATSEADGNLTGLSGAGITQTFAYDQANRLTGITTNGATTTNSYNGDGLRISQTANGTTTSYVWDVNRALPQVLSDGVRTYVYGLGLAYSVDDSNNVAVYHTDGLGSVRALTDGSGNVVQTYLTEALGAIVAQTSVNAPPYVAATASALTCMPTCQRR